MGLSVAGTKSQTAKYFSDIFVQSLRVYYEGNWSSMEKRRQISRGMLSEWNPHHSISCILCTAHQSFGFDVQDARSSTAPIQERWIDQPIIAGTATTDQPTRIVKSPLLRKRRDDYPVASSKNSFDSFDLNTRSIIRLSDDRKHDWILNWFKKMILFR